jgi:phosphoribosyl 1,2-cyclic phosphate phosphodiesterase
MDDVRRFNVLQKRPMPCFGDARTVADIRQAFAYAFNSATTKGGGLPQIVPFTIHGPFCVGRQEVVPVPLLHGERPILGFRFGGFAYLTDCSSIPDTSWGLLEGLEALVIDALRDRPHPTHFTLEEAIGASRRIAAPRTYFTHMCHDLPHAETSARLPDGVELAYDGLVIEVGSGLTAQARASRS